MNKDISNYFRRDFFEMMAVLEFIKEKDSYFNIKNFCDKWTEENENTEFSRLIIEKLVKMSLEDYLLKKTIVRYNIKNINSIYSDKLIKIYSSTKILDYILNNEYSEDKSTITTLLKNDKKLTELGYSYDVYEKMNISYKVSNLFYSEYTYNLIKKKTKEFENNIKNMENDIIYELENRRGINNTKKIESYPKEIVKVENKSKVDKIKNENNSIKQLFDDFYDDLLKIIPNQDNQNKDDKNNFLKLKEEYDLIVSEKRNLEEKIKNLENELKNMNDRYIELQNTINSKECESNFKAIENIYKILNDKDDLFLDKIYAAKNNMYNLNLEDIKRITSNLISNIETLGIRVNPMSKKVNEKIIIKEEDLPKYRFANKIADEVISKNSLEVSVKYPSWIYIDKEYSKAIRNLDNEMIE